MMEIGNAISQALHTARSAAPDQSGRAIKEAAQDFEAFVASEFLENMFSSLEPDAIFGGGESENIFRSFLIQEYGRSLANSGSLGISDLVRRELLRVQEEGTHHG